MKFITIEEGDFTKENLNNAIKNLDLTIRDFLKKGFNYDKVSLKKIIQREKYSPNIMFGTLMKFIQIQNNLLINLKICIEFIEKPELITKKSDFFEQKCTAIFFFQRARNSFFIDSFSVFDDILTILFDFLFTEDDLEKLEKSNFAKFLEDDEIKNLILKKFPKDVKKLEKQSSFIDISRKIDQLKEKNFIDEKEKKFLHGYRIIRNSLHNNGFHKGNDCKIELFDESFEFKNGDPIEIITLNRYINWINQIVLIFEKIALRVDYKNIIDPTT